MLRVQNQGGMHRANPQVARLLRMQEAKEMPSDRIVVGFYFNAPTVRCIVVPIEEHRTQGRHDLVGEGTGTWMIVVFPFRQVATQCRYASPQNIHGML